MNNINNDLFKDDFYLLSEDDKTEIDSMLEVLALAIWELIENKRIRKNEKKDKYNKKLHEFIYKYLS